MFGLVRMKYDQPESVPSQPERCNHHGRNLYKGPASPRHDMKHGSYTTLPCEIKAIPSTEYPLIFSDSKEERVAPIPPNRPSPTSSMGSRNGRKASAWSAPDGAGLSTPPAASTRIKLPLLISSSLECMEGCDDSSRAILISSTRVSSISKSEVLAPSLMAARCGDTGSV